MKISDLKFSTNNHSIATLLNKIFKIVLYILIKRWYKSKKFKTI